MLEALLAPAVTTVGGQLVRVQHIQANKKAFAAILDDGSVVTWGRRSCGGDSNQVREQLVGVQQIQATPPN